MRGRRAAAVGTGAMLMLLAVPAAHAAAPRARILAFRATPSSLPAAGGTVHLTARVDGAAVCRFSAEVAVRHLPATRPCAGGASLTVTVPANHARHRRAVVFVLRAGTAAGTAVVHERAAGSVAPVVTTQPAGVTVTAGALATFTALASGSPAPAVRWQQSVDGGQSWIPISGARTTTISFTATAGENGYQLRAVFTNPAGSATSAAATLTVEVAPAITGAPPSASVTAGRAVALVAAASGNPAPAVQWQSSSDGGVTWANIAGATAASYTLLPASWQSGWQFRAVFTNVLGSAATAPMTLTVLPAHDTIWSGYVDVGTTFTMVTGSWTVPALDCAATPDAHAGIWVGIDGAAATAGATVEQDGIVADCTAGVPHYNAWYEMYGDAAVNNGNPVNLPTSTYPVAVGDTITATATYAAGTWTFALNDQGWPSSFSVAVPDPAPPTARDSAEWIVEKGPGLPLTSFGSVTFSGASATGGGATGPISAFPSIQTLLTGTAPLLASPGPLGPAGDSFTDTWVATS